jgi:hypothetical protein
MYILYDCLMSELLYLCLSSSQIVYNRSPAATQTGTWQNTWHGSYSSTNAATTTTTVTGRYVGCAFTLGNAAQTCTVSIDGATAIPLTTYVVPNTTNDPAYSGLTYLFDTGSAGVTHTVLVTNTQASALFVEYFFGFDTLGTTTNASVIVMGLESTTFQGTPASATVNRQSLINNFQYGIVKMMRQNYGAKMTFVSSIPQFSWGNKLSDGINPDVHGHIRLANSVTSTLTTGETIPYV